MNESELANSFSASELEVRAAFRREHRRHEWSLSRIAVKQLAVEMGLAIDPKSCTVGVGTLRIDDPPQARFASLSHSGRYAAAIIGEEPVGIDVQTIRDLPERAAHLFLTPAETEAMERCAIEHRILHFWCAKEAAWKRGLGAVETLTQVPLVIEEESPGSLRFDSAETLRIGDVIVAVSRRAP